MACNSMYKTRGVSLADGTPVKILSANIHRKYLMLGAKSNPVMFAFGPAPAVDDYFEIPAHETIRLKEMTPASDVWATGPGTIVIAEVV